MKHGEGRKQVGGICTDGSSSTGMQWNKGSAAAAAKKRSGVRRLGFCDAGILWWRRLCWGGLRRLKRILVQIR